MCLIIFFLMVSTLASDRESDIELPETRTGERDEEDAGFIVVSIAPRDRANAGFEDQPISVRVDGREQIDLVTLEAALRARLRTDPGTPVQIRADKGLSFDAVAPVLAACRDAGAKSFRNATRSASGGRAVGRGTGAEGGGP